jgi:hypothetical protein
MVQDGCFVEWRDMIADAAKKGFAGGVPFQWNSHKILTEQLRQEWLEKLQKRRSMPRPTGNRRAPKSPEQRRKIAEAIAAKWLDQVRAYQCLPEPISCFLSFHSDVTWVTETACRLDIA